MSFGASIAEVVVVVEADLVVMIVEQPWFGWFVEEVVVVELAEGNERIVAADVVAE